MKKVIAVVGARPQFIKHAAIDIAGKKCINLVTIHTGQHYDDNMSKIFFEQLKITHPDYMLKIGGYDHGEQTGLMMIEIEKILKIEKPDAVLVYGDTNSTLAGALVAAKLHVPVIHVEAGLRSYNKLMPEEVNRVLTDHISDLLFATSEIAVRNLEKEGINIGVLNVGDVMHDMIRVASKILPKEERDPYIYVTLHRPYNVDDSDRLKNILDALQKLNLPVIFPIHPRTWNRMAEYRLSEKNYDNISFIKPLSYFENIRLLYSSVGLITDSGGMQKEAYWLKKKCITIRTETEWVETLENGWNTLLFNNFYDLNEIHKPVLGPYKELYGNGKAAEEIVERIRMFLND